MVQFRPLNLLNDFSSLGTFDLVFCRNVLIYFDQETKIDVLNRLARQMPRRRLSGAGRRRNRGRPDRRLQADGRQARALRAERGGARRPKCRARERRRAASSRPGLTLSSPVMVRSAAPSAGVASEPAIGVLARAAGASASAAIREPPGDCSNHRVVSGRGYWPVPVHEFARGVVVPCSIGWGASRVSR